jgi:hypothetical protein
VCTQRTRTNHHPKFRTYSSLVTHQNHPGHYQGQDWVAGEQKQ